MSEYTDITITCKDCGKDFVFTASGQAFFAEKGYTQPVRCKSCREKRKAEKEGGQR